MSIANIKMYPLPSGEVIVSYFDSVKRKRIQKKFADEIAARSFHQEIKTTKPELPKATQVMVGALLRRYLAVYPDCYLGRSRRLVREFLEVFELYRPEDLSEVAMRGFLIQLKNENDYSNRSMLRIKSMLQGFFKFLIEKEFLERSPLENIKFERGTPYKRKTVVLPNQEIKNQVTLAKKYSPALFYPIFLLIWETGAKTSDILSLQWKDLNFKTRIISLIRSRELQPRTTTMSDELASAMRRIQPVGPLVFTTLEGKPFQKHILARELKRFQRQMKLDTNWGLRDLRVSFAAHFLRSGGSIKNLQEIMGHVRPYQTEEVYGQYKTAVTDILTEPAAVQGTGAVSSSDTEF